VRDLAKSMMRFSWSLSLFGYEQMSCLLRPRVGTERAAAALDSVARATEEQLGPATRSTFQAGNDLQRGMVDLFFDLLDPRAWGRAGGIGLDGDAVRRSLAAGLDVARRSAEMVVQAGQASSAPAAGGATSGPAPASGWGPMPGAGR
jgi:hypothetical protein